MNYWDYRKKAIKLAPRMTTLSGKGEGFKMKEKGRKSNYHQYSIKERTNVKMERLLDTETIGSFAEVSLRAQSCPMPLNIDVWDGLTCPMGCKYCFADYFRHSLYTSFFDNGKTLGLRSCNANDYKNRLDELFKHRGEKTSWDKNELVNAIRLQIPIRLGIRFEDFPPIEREKGVALQLLDYLADNKYPLMINTKSVIPGEDKYLNALARNPAGTAIHYTLISSDDTFLRKIEPGAPTFKQRLNSMKRLAEAGVRVVARIEPWMFLLNDSKDMVDHYIGELKAAGVRHMTFDSYSYSANSKGLETNFRNLGIDFRRMFLISSDSQWLSSLLLGKFIQYFRDNGMECSTFDQGNAPDNDDMICCSVGDKFEDYGFNWGSGVTAIKFIQSRGMTPTTWGHFIKWIEEKGGFLSKQLHDDVKLLWNGRGDGAWPIYWSWGLEAIGQNSEGTIWRFNREHDFREEYWRQLCD